MRFLSLDKMFSATGSCYTVEMMMGSTFLFSFAAQVAKGKKLKTSPTPQVKGQLLSAAKKLNIKKAGSTGKGDSSLQEKGRL